MYILEGCLHHMVPEMVGVGVQINGRDRTHQTMQPGVIPSYSRTSASI